MTHRRGCAPDNREEEDQHRSQKDQSAMLLSPQLQYPSAYRLPDPLCVSVDVMYRHWVLSALYMCMHACMHVRSLGMLTRVQSCR